jgi:hypothetical protein
MSEKPREHKHIRYKMGDQGDGTTLLTVTEQTHGGREFGNDSPNWQSSNGLWLCSALSMDFLTRHSMKNGMDMALWVAGKDPLFNSCSIPSLHGETVRFALDEYNTVHGPSEPSELEKLREENERLREALISARPYVEGCYGYSFPNAQKNQSVLDAIDQAISHPDQKQEEKKDA